MDVNISYAVSNEDLVGVLRTILLFLESINFKTTSTVLQKECSSKGYLQVGSAPPKVVIVHSSPIQTKVSHQGNQTEFPIVYDKYELESSCHQVINTEDNLNSNSLHAYYTNTNNTTESFKNNMFDQGNTCVVGSGGHKYIDEKIIVELKENQNMSPSKQNKHLDSRRCPNTVESEIPTKISSKLFQIKTSNNKLYQEHNILRKTNSDPTLKTNIRSIKDKNKESENICDSRQCTNTVDGDCQELRKKLRHLQNEHRKLMGVTTELCTALQTHILGQSENLNSMLNNCRNIYPDLFKSAHYQNCDCHQTTEQYLSSTDTDVEFSNQTNVGQTITFSSNMLQSSIPSSKRQKCDCHNNSQDLLPPRTTIRNIIRSPTPPRKNSDGNVSQGSLLSRKTIRNSDNILYDNSSLRKNKGSDSILQKSLSSRKAQDNKNISQSTSPKKKSLDNNNTSQGSLPCYKTIGNSDNIIRNTTSPTKNQDTGNMSQGSIRSTKTIGNSNNKIQDATSSRNQHPKGILQTSLPSSKTIRSSDNIVHSTTQFRRIQDSDNLPQGSFSTNETIENCNILVQCKSSPRNQNDSNISQGSLPSGKTIRNSDNIIQSTSASTNNQDGANVSGGSLPSIKTIRSSEREIFVEIKRIVSNGSTCSTTILTPNLKRPHSSSIILITTNDEPQRPDSKILLRQLSSKSLDESLLISNSKSKEIFERNCKTADEDNVSEIITTEDTCQIPEIRNAQQQTCLTNTGYKVHQESPEIFVTTEHLEKVQRECKCKSSGESNYSSPRSMYFELDFRKLKKDMLNGEDNLKLGLIQALRWRITQSDREARDQVISSYIRHDLLGLHSAPNLCGQSTTEIYYCPNKETPHPLQEGMARLVNAFASLTLGRDYLCQDDDFLISLLVPLVIGTHYSKVIIDDVTRDMLMATLQKLSIRNRQRMRMIAAGLVEYLVTFLATKHTTISEYCMEYTSALLMNLCLHREARKLLHSSATDVVSLLADLLNTKHRSCMPYVNGAMYSLLGDACINKEAQRLNLAKLIEYHIKRTDGEMRRQLEFILKLHLKGDGQNECGCDPNLEPENEVDLLEPELDSDDFTKTHPAGEELLKKYKLLFSVNGAQVNSSYLKCLCRPVTPRSTQSTEKLVHVTDNIEICGNQLIEDVEEHIPQEPAKRKCSCFADKSTQSENSNAVDFRSNPPQCMCTPANTNNTDPIKTKRGNSQSEPITSFKCYPEKPTKPVPLSERSSRSNSPDMSYSEETKQFYHTPSAKAGIFEPQKQKKLHRVPPSFTRTIPLPHAPHKLSPTCDNPFCAQPYSKSMPVSPKENSSAKHPPYALDYPIGVATCYRENYTNQIGNLGTNMTCTNCSNNNKRSRYSCNCYNVIKGYIDQTPPDNINNNRNENSDEKFAVPPQNICCHCHNPSNVNQMGCPAQNVNDTAINYSNDVLVNFSYEELLQTVRPNDHVCPNLGVDCQCYDVVFQSRPKILRTPP